MRKFEESDEQKKIFKWAKDLEQFIPEMALLHHIPNGQKLGGNAQQRMIRGKRLKDEGMKAGVPDICLPIPSGRYHGLYIELKKPSGGTVSSEQEKWLVALNLQGYLAVVCRGANEAIQTIEDYLDGR